MAKIKKVKPEKDDIFEAYNEAIIHLEMCMDEIRIWDNPEKMRAAYDIVMNRLIRARDRIKL